MYLLCISVLAVVYIFLANVVSLPGLFIFNHGERSGAQRKVENYMHSLSISGLAVVYIF